jgi:TPR repeat protein
LTAQGAEPAESKTEKPGKTTTPGAEELAKAANASDSAAASAWLWKAVAKGNPEAPVKLANMYIKGDGVPQSCDQAIVLLRSAAAKENAAARSRLGALYATGTCVPRNRVRAYQYMNQALEVNPNAVWARDFRQQLWTQMTPEERQQAQRAQ